MNADDLFSYLLVTDQLDDSLGYKGKVLKCDNCNNELYIYEDNILYCPNCNNFTKYYRTEKIYNKKLTYEQKRRIKY